MKRVKISGWGNYPKVKADAHCPCNFHEVKSQNETASNYIARGAGRSYGDAATSNSVMFTSQLGETIEFSVEEGFFICQAGKLLLDVLNEIVPYGYFLPVTPGTKYVSVGGAIAADVHGKNHHVDGCFSQYLNSFKLMTASGQILTCSRVENRDLFWATCGGMGLTGVILEASFQLMKIESSKILNRTVKCFNLDETIQKILENNQSKYSVAWVDCAASGKNFGQSLLQLGEHAPALESNSEDLKNYRFPSSNIGVPFDTPSWLLNRFVLKMFNNLQFRRFKHPDTTTIVELDEYFFPLDKLNAWNRLYGKAGLIQYQVVIPMANAEEGMYKLLRLIESSKEKPFLAVLKLFGEESDGWLSFPQHGLQIALDFKRTEQSLALMNQLDELVEALRGRAYLAKDTRMNKTFFGSGYSRLQEFKNLLGQIDPSGKFKSDLSNRLGITR